MEFVYPWMGKSGAPLKTVVILNWNYFKSFASQQTVLSQVHVAWCAGETWQSVLPFMWEKTKSTSRALWSLFLPWSAAFISTCDWKQQQGGISIWRAWLLPGGLQLVDGFWRVFQLILKKKKSNSPRTPCGQVAVGSFGDHIEKNVGNEQLYMDWWFWDSILFVNEP